MKRVLSHESSRRPRWLVVAGPLLVVGVVGSVFGAQAVAHQDAREAREAFERSSAAVTSTLQLAIQHQDDLVVNASGFVVANPSASQAEFDAWSTSTHVLDRYPEVLGFGFAVMVPDSGLAAFKAMLIDDAEGALTLDDVALDPPGVRPYYCLSRLTVARQGEIASPGHDWCAAETVGATNLFARDSGQSVYTPVEIGGSKLLSVNVPVYRGGFVPVTLAARRADFLGWVGTISIPQLALDAALQDRPNMAIAMRYASTSSTADFTGGVVPAGDQTMTVDLHNGWTIQTYGPSTDSGLASNGDSLAVLLGGIGVSVLVSALAYVLLTSRSRALRLVDERTAELRHQALHDALTGLPNRALIMDRIEQLLVRNRRNGTSCAALYLDLDDFKNVNDTLGHEAGDRLLVAVAGRLTDALREADTIGRMGGDEFVVLVDGAHSESDLVAVANRVLDAMSSPFDLAGTPLPLAVHISIGMAIGDRSSGGDLLRDADVALYQAKADGKNGFATFHSSMQMKISRRIALEFDLRSAVDMDQFALVYQPIYNLTDLSVVGVEALLRWDHPVLGAIQPDEFIPILEQSGQIFEVGRWVLFEACAQTAVWHASGDVLDISVNVSGRQLDHDCIIADITGALAASALPATSLIVEVTETALMRSAEDATRRLREIKSIGARIAVDDFGTGYSSLAYLQQFPVDRLKIDRRFTNAIAATPGSQPLIRTLVRLGRDLGLMTLAEGVETTDEMDLLRAEGVDEAQGFLLSRPLDPVALETQILAPARQRSNIE